MSPAAPKGPSPPSHNGHNDNKDNDDNPVYIGSSSPSPEAHDPPMDVSDDEDFDLFDSANAKKRGPSNRTLFLGMRFYILPCAQCPKHSSSDPYQKHHCCDHLARLITTCGGIVVESLPALPNGGYCLLPPGGLSDPYLQGTAVIASQQCTILYDSYIYHCIDYGSMDKIHDENRDFRVYPNLPPRPEPEHPIIAPLFRERSQSKSLPTPASTPAPAADHFLSPHEDAQENALMAKNQDRHGELSLHGLSISGIDEVGEDDDTHAIAPVPTSDHDGYRPRDDESRTHTPSPPPSINCLTADLSNPSSSADIRKTNTISSRESSPDEPLMAPRKTRSTSSRAPSVRRSNRKVAPKKKKGALEDERLKDLFESPSPPLKSHPAPPIPSKGKGKQKEETRKKPVITIPVPAPSPPRAAAGPQLAANPVASPVTLSSPPPPPHPPTTLLPTPNYHPRASGYPGISKPTNVKALPKIARKSAPVPDAPSVAANQPAQRQRPPPLSFDNDAPNPVLGAFRQQSGAPLLSTESDGGTTPIPSGDGGHTTQPIAGSGNNTLKIPGPGGAFGGSGDARRPSPSGYPSTVPTRPPLTGSNVYLPPNYRSLLSQTPLRPDDDALSPTERYQHWHYDHRRDPRSERPRDNRAEPLRSSGYETAPIPLPLPTQQARFHDRQENMGTRDPREGMRPYDRDPRGGDAGSKRPWGGSMEDTRDKRPRPGI